jgi:TonB family protein
MNLVAPPEERLLEPRPQMSAARRRFVVIVLFCFFLHALGIGLVARYGGSGAPASEQQETPVEVVDEIPPQQPRPPQPQSEQPPAQKTEWDEKEATDSPRAKNEEKPQKEAQDKESHAPKAEPTPAPAEMKPAKNPAPAEKPTEANAEEQAPLRKDDHADGEPLKAADQPKPDPAQTKAETAAQKPEPPQPAAKPPATAKVAPDYAFAPASNYAPIAGGNAASTYLSIVYDMVHSHMSLPKVAAGRRHTMGEIEFYVDYGGGLLGAKVVKSTGLPDLDAAAMAAIRASAPFPLPPTGSGISLRMKYSGN